MESGPGEGFPPFAHFSARPQRNPRPGCLRRVPLSSDVHLSVERLSLVCVCVRACVTYKRRVISFTTAHLPRRRRAGGHAHVVGPTWDRFREIPPALLVDLTWPWQRRGGTETEPFFSSGVSLAVENSRPRKQK